MTWRVNYNLLHISYIPLPKTSEDLPISNTPNSTSLNVRPDFEGKYIWEGKQFTRSWF